MSIVSTTSRGIWWQVNDITNITLGVLLFIYFFTQVVLALLNHRRIRSLQDKIPEDQLPSIAFMVVGYRENADYWEGCVRSLLNTDYGRVTTVGAFIDGNEPEDEYMKDIFDRLANENEEQRSFPVSLHLLNHGGKRHVMEAGFRYISKEYPSNEYIIVIDSDTIIHPQSVLRLVESIHQDPHTGCATGSLRVFNQDSVLARVINARYAYAFDIERSAMSYPGTMNCCSGPFSIYRQTLLDQEFIEDFIGQQCCGHSVGPGDDRHATALILMRGYQSRQSPLAVVETETPNSFHRYLQQQLRWMRSFYREQAWQIRAIPHQNPYLLFTTLYELLFPFLIIFSFFSPSTFHRMDPQTALVIMGRRFLVTLGVVVFRTSLLFLVTHEVGAFWNLLMLPLYLLFLLPIKLYALSTCSIQSWLTSSRKTILSRCTNPDVLMIYVSILLWNTTIAYFLFRLLHGI